jgi:hypothetical protein
MERLLLGERAEVKRLLAKGCGQGLCEGYGDSTEDAVICNRCACLWAIFQIYPELDPSA